MFDPFRLFSKRNQQPSTAAKIEAAQTDANSVRMPCSEFTHGKRCPKCYKGYPLNSVICQFDSSLLMIINADAPVFLRSVEAIRADKTKWPLRCEFYLGSGSICDVYEATDSATGETFAVKALMLDLISDSKSARKFVEGVKKGMKLQHENIVRTVALGVAEGAKETSRRPIVVCDFMRGKPLSKLITKEGLPSLKQTLSMAHDVCAALEHAHGQGIMHGDLKPSNIFLESNADNDIVQVSDFAIAERLFQGLEWTQVTTMTCSIYGSVTYLAPDYAHSRNPTEVADIYSLGCIMYECLTGRPPFVADSDFLTIMKHMDEPPMPFSADYTPKPVVQIVMKALEKDPRKRWQSAAEMRTAIEKLQG